MATKRQDVELGVGVNVSNADRIRALASDLQTLVKQGGAAAPEFKKLGDELDKLAGQQAAVDTLNKIESELTATSESLQRATTNATEFGDRMQQQAASVDRLRQAQADAKNEYDQTRLKAVELQRQLDILRATTDRAGKSSDEYKTAQRELVTQLSDLDAAASRQKIALENTNAELRKAEAELRKTETANRNAAKAVGELSSKLDSQSQDLAQVQAALAASGVAAKSASDAQAEVSQALEEVRQKSRQTQAEIEGYEFVVKEATKAEQAWAAEKAAAEKATQARKLQEAASYVNFWTQELEKNEAAQRQLEEQQRRTAQSQQILNDAFSKTGVRSAAMIRDEINEIGGALIKLANNSKVTAADFDRAFASAQQRIQQLERELETLPGHVEKTGKFTEFLRGQFVQLAAAYGGIELGQKFIDANVQLETLRRSLTLITGSTEAAAAQIRFLQQTSDRAGLSVGELSADFVRFSASAKASNIPMEVMRGVFEQLTMTAGQLGISTDKVGLQLQALSQIANKGKVSLEELQGQLGESLPGALSVTARGLGITEAQLVKLIESGKLLAEDFFPAFQSGLKLTFGEGQKEIEGFQATWSRLKNVMTETAQTFGDAGFMVAIAGALKALAAAISPVVIGFSVLTDGLFSTIRAAAAFAGTLAGGGSFSQALKSAGEQTEGLIDRQTKLIESYKKMLLGSEENAKSQQASAATTQAASQTIAESAGGIATNTQAHQASGAAATSNAQAQLAAGSAATSAASAAAAAGASWTQLTVRYLELRAEAEKQTLAAEKLADAKRIEGETSVRIAQLSGDEARARAAAVSAAEANVTATSNAAAARQREVDLLVQQRDALLENIRVTGQSSDSKAKEIETLQQAITTKQAEAEKSLQQAQAAREEAAAKQIVAQTYQDNSAKVKEYAAAVKEAEGILASYQIEEARGLATKDQVRQATVALAQANALYRDALKDVADAAERKINAIRRDNALGEQALRVDLQRAKSAEAIASSIGNEIGALQARIKQKEIEIELQKLAIKALEAESAAIRDLAEKERAYLISKGEFNEAKKAEYELRIANAKAKQLEADSGKAVVEQLNAERQAIVNRNAAAAGGIGSSSSSGASSASSSSASSSSGSSSSSSASTSSASKSSSTTGMSALLPTWLSIFNQLKSRGLTDAQATQIAREFTDSSGNVPFYNNPGQIKYGGQGGTLEYAVDRAAEKVIRQQAEGTVSTNPNAVGVKKPSSSSSSTSTASTSSSASSSVPTSAATTGSTYKVEISINGQVSSVALASDADAVALTRILQQLQTAAGRSA